VYVAPKISGVFALGGYTIGLGEASIGAGHATPALLVATAAAADQLRRGLTQPELPLIWWAAPWWFAKQIPRHLLPRRWQPLIKVWAVCMVVAAIVSSARDGQPLRVRPGRLRGHRPLHHCCSRPPPATRSPPSAAAG
jgi:hypothetical protein